MPHANLTDLIENGSGEDWLEYHRVATPAEWGEFLRLLKRYQNELKAVVAKVDASHEAGYEADGEKE